MEPTYWQRLREATRDDFTSFWSAHRFWVTFVTLLTTCVPLGIQVARHGVGSMVHLEETITSALAGLIVSLGGNYIISMGRAAKTLDAGLRNEIQQRDRAIAERDQEIQRREQAIRTLTEKPKRTTAEQHHYETAQVALKKLGPNGVVVLRHLSRHGTLTFGIFSPPLPEGLDIHMTKNILDRAVTDGLVTFESTQTTHGRATRFKISDVMKAALDELLYLPSDS